ncbi:FxsC protein [Streptomyces sp. Act143]|uniref:FxsC protein n=1 Tax=Streptomyces sp. Act143 TaxID=2200760 RepID=UPI0015E814E4|nr:FxsC protein [Streptomyces sp. Act143]
MLGHRPAHEGRLKPAEPIAGPDPMVLSCRSMLVLYSSEYLDDPQCAREWSVFRERMDRRARQTGKQPDCLVGVVWRTDGLVLPRLVANTGHIVDEEYEGPGVLGLQQDPGRRERYRSLVRRVAERLVRAARATLPAMTEADSRRVPSHFGPRRTAAPQQHQDTRPSRPSGDEPQVVLVLLAGTRERMARLRTSVTAYGDSPEQWRPFRPHSEEPAVSVAGHAVYACGTDRLTVLTPDLDDPDVLSGVPESAIVLVLVDPWLSKDGAFSTLWNRLARTRTRITAVLVVLSRLDEESWRGAADLRERLSLTPARLLGASHHEVGSAESLRHTVAAVMVDSRTGPADPGAPPAPVGDQVVESSAERRIRRQRERVGWLRQGAGPWPPLLGRTPGESLGGG